MSRKLKLLKEKLHSLNLERNKLIDRNQYIVTEDLIKKRNALNKEIELVEREIFKEKYGFYNEWMVVDKVVPIWDDKGSYTWDFMHSLHMPLLTEGIWSCTYYYKTQKDACGNIGRRCDGDGNELDDYCNSATRIRLSWDSNVIFKGERLKKYMKKPDIEKLFGVRIPKKDLIDLFLVAGFYLFRNRNGPGAGFSAIIDVEEFVLRYIERILKKHDSIIINGQEIYSKESDA